MVSGLFQEMITWSSSRVVHQVIQFALRDYIHYWYYTLSEDETFLLEIRQTVQNALVEFSTR